MGRANEMRTFMRKLRHLVWFGLAALGAAAAEPIASPTQAFTAVTAAGHWPSFRGPYACGVAEGQNLPEQWDGPKGVNLRWKRKLPGLAHSSPIVWSNRLFVTTAISSLPEATFRPGLYGDGDASPDRSPHRWQVLCLDKRTGEILWERTAAEGIPKDKRHVKATYANATPATDGRYVVALFGSEGLFAYDLQGRPLWQKDLGRLNAGAYDAPSYEWGTASSPIIHRNLVIVQGDLQEGSFILAADLKTGASSRDTQAISAGMPVWSRPKAYVLAMKSVNSWRKHRNSSAERGISNDATVPRFSWLAEAGSMSGRLSWPGVFASPIPDLHQS
jgi:hypothetical protein